MILSPRGCQLLFVCVLIRSTRAVQNDGTEAQHALQHVEPARELPSNASMNQARNGGRGASDAARKGPDQSQVGCRELRSTKYISDGQCTSINPIKELVCAGECLPAHLLPNWIGAGSHTGRYWSRREAQEWRCVIDRTRTQRIRLQCQDGSSRTYKITVVTSCKCKRYSRQQNDSGHKSEARGPKDQAVVAAGGAGSSSNKRGRERKTPALPEDWAGEQAKN